MAGQVELPSPPLQSAGLSAVRAPTSHWLFLLLLLKGNEHYLWTQTGIQILGPLVKPYTLVRPHFRLRTMEGVPYVILTYSFPYYDS